MVSSFVTILATALSLLVVDILFAGVSLDNFPAALVAAVGIGLINIGVKPIIALLSLPLNILSLGAFSLVINGFCFWLASLLVPGFKVAGLGAFILAPVILAMVNSFLDGYFADKFSSTSQ